MTLENQSRLYQSSLWMNLKTASAAIAKRAIKVIKFIIISSFSIAVVQAHTIRNEYIHTEEIEGM